MKWATFDERGEIERFGRRMGVGGVAEMPGGVESPHRGRRRRLSVFKHNMKQVIPLKERLYQPGELGWPPNGLRKRLAGARGGRGRAWEQKKSWSIGSILRPGIFRQLCSS